MLTNYALTAERLEQHWTRRYQLTSGVCDSEHACVREADILNTCCKFICIDIRTADNIPGRHLLTLNVIAPYRVKYISCKVQLRIQVLQGRAATKLRWGGRYNTTFLSSRSENTTVKRHPLFKTRTHAILQSSCRYT